MIMHIPSRGGLLAVVLAWLLVMGGAHASEGVGLLGLYYQNPDLTGLAAIHRGEKVDQDLGRFRPDDAVGIDNFSIRWIGWLTPTVTGMHTFFLRGDDGVRLRVGPQLVIDHWVDQATTEWSGTAMLAAGVPVAIEVDYYEHTGSAVYQWSWQPPGQARQVVPVERLALPVDTTAPSAVDALSAAYISDHSITLQWTAASDDLAVGAYTIFRNGVAVGTSFATTWSDRGLASGTTARYAVQACDALGNRGPLSSEITVTTTPPAPVGSGRGLAATYFSDASLTTAVLQRTDATIDFNWGAGTPDPKVPADFTASWVGDLQARYSEVHVIHVTADTHVRLWLGQQLLIDAWAVLSQVEQQATIALEAGRRYPLRIEYRDQGARTARLSLRWESQSLAQEVIPAAQLYPAPPSDPLQNEVLSPGASRTSPAWCEGLVADAEAVVALHVGDQVVPVVRSGSRRWFADNASQAGRPRGVLLVADHPTTIQIEVANHGHQARSEQVLTWAVTDLTGSNASAVLTIRPGDRLLVTARRSEGRELALDADFDGTTFAAQQRGVPGQALEVAYATAGLHVLAARIDGTIVGQVTVQVPAVDLRGPIAGQVDARRTKDVGVVPLRAAPALAFTGNEEGHFEVAVVGTTGDGLTLGLRALHEGDYRLQARIGGSQGAILAEVPFDDFVASTTAATHTVFIEQLPDGTDVVEATLSMRPLVPGLEFTLRSFVSGVTFADSLPSLTLASDAFTRVGDSGTCAYRLLMAPGSHTRSCHTITITQQGVRISR